MTSSTVVVGVSVLYLVACLAVGMLPGRKSSDSAAGYVAGDRSLGLFVMYFITGATIFSAYAFLGVPGRAYSSGGYAYMVLAYGTLGFIPFYFLGPRASRLGKAYGFVTQAEMVAARFRMRSIAGAMAAISILAFVPYLALQMKGAGIVLGMMTHGAVPEWAGAAIVYGVVMVYVLKSGVLGVGWTNTFQGIFMMVLAWGLGLYLPYKLHGGVGPMFEKVVAADPSFVQAPGPGRGWSMYTSSVVATAIGFSVWPHLFMKAFTAKDVRTIQRTVVLYPTFQFFLVPIILIGFAGIGFEPAPDKADDILPHILMNAQLPSVVVGLFCAGALAASMSSGDAMAHATSSILVRDGLVSAGGMKLTPHGERRLIQIFVVVVMIASYVTALVYQGNLFDLLVKFAYGPITQFAPAVLVTLCVRRATGQGILAGLVAGIAAYLVFTYFPDLRPFEIHNGLYGLTANVLALVVVSALTQPASFEEDEHFLAVAKGEKTPA